MRFLVGGASCRGCGGSQLLLGLDLGSLPLANSFLIPERAFKSDSEPRYPLRMFYCSDCGLIQLLDLVQRGELFDDYAFLTGSSKTSLLHFDQYADELVSRLSLGAKDLVVDIGSNDGTLLNAFKKRGTSILGIEPARNVASRAIEDGIPTLVEYFGPKTVERLGQGSARVISANNVVSHVADLDGFVESVSALLNSKGIFAFEVPWVVEVLRKYNFDMVYHEHLSYFGFKPLSKVFARHGLEFVGLEYFPKIHGGTFRGLVSHRGTASSRSEALERAFREEEKAADYRALTQFADHVQELRRKLTGVLKTLRNEGSTIAGYGAPAKATILLNYCSIDRSILEFVTDTTPLKQGKLIPGVHIPIVSPEEFHTHPPDYALLLAWNFKDEILAKEQEYVKSGGKFIVPFPEPEIIS